MSKIHIPTMQELAEEECKRLLLEAEANEKLIAIVNREAREFIDSFLLRRLICEQDFTPPVSIVYGGTYDWGRMCNSLTATQHAFLMSLLTEAADKLVDFGTVRRMSYPKLKDMFGEKNAAFLKRSLTDETVSIPELLYFTD